MGRLHPEHDVALTGALGEVAEGDDDLLGCELCLDYLRPNRPRPTIQQLLSFIHAAEAGTFAAAARELMVEPQAVRQAIGELERLVGRLFERSHQGLELTPPGRRVLPLARRIVHLATVIGTVTNDTDPEDVGRHRRRERRTSCPVRSDQS